MNYCYPAGLVWTKFLLVCGALGVAPFIKNQEPHAFSTHSKYPLYTTFVVKSSNTHAISMIQTIYIYTLMLDVWVLGFGVYIHTHAHKKFHAYTIINISTQIQFGITINPYQV